MPAREAGVGRRPNRHPRHEERLPRPRIVAIGVHTDGEVESHSEATRVEPFAETAEIYKAAKAKNDAEQQQIAAIRDGRSDRAWVDATLKRLGVLG